MRPEFKLREPNGDLVSTICDAFCADLVNLSSQHPYNYDRASRQPIWESIAKQSQDPDIVNRLFDVLSRAYRVRNYTKEVGMIFMFHADELSKLFLTYLTVGKQKQCNPNAVHEFWAIADGIAQSLGFENTQDEGFRVTDFPFLVKSVMDGTVNLD